jgi:hypothetical protein
MVLLRLFVWWLRELEDDVRWRLRRKDEVNQ